MDQDAASCASCRSRPFERASAAGGREAARAGVRARDDGRADAYEWCQTSCCADEDCASGEYCANRTCAPRLPRSNARRLSDECDAIEGLTDDRCKCVDPSTDADADARHRVSVKCELPIEISHSAIGTLFEGTVGIIATLDPCISLTTEDDPAGISFRWFYKDVQVFNNEVDPDDGRLVDITCTQKAAQYPFPRLTISRLGYEGGVYITRTMQCSPDGSVRLKSGIDFCVRKSGRDDEFNCFSDAVEVLGEKFESNLPSLDFFKLSFKTDLDFCSAPESLGSNSNGTNTTTESTANETASDECFPAAATVLTRAGPIPIGDVRVGDEVLVDGAQFSAVHLLSHVDRSGALRAFVRIALDSGHAIELTGHHFAVVVDGAGRRSHVAANDVRIGQTMLVVTDAGRGSSTARVVEVSRVLRDGLFAPVTLQGALVVNGVVVSSYSNVMGSLSPLLDGELGAHVAHASLALSRFCLVHHPAWHARVTAQLPPHPKPFSLLGEGSYTHLVLIILKTMSIADAPSYAQGLATLAAASAAIGAAGAANAYVQIASALGTVARVLRSGCWACRGAVIPLARAPAAPCA